MGDELDILSRGSSLRTENVVTSSGRGGRKVERGRLRGRWKGGRNLRVKEMLQCEGRAVLSYREQGS